MGENEVSGVIFKTRRFSLHDGPGIRTSIFLMGCPLNCRWCHNPEGITEKISVWHNENICIGCSLCVDKCPENALSLFKGQTNRIIIRRDLCTISGNCVAVCPSSAITFTGKVITAGEVMQTVLRDRLFYDTSGGGVTLTGGEPLYQPDFAAAILKNCRDNEIHTAIETSLFCDRASLEIIKRYTDLFLIDIKLIDDVEHRKYTGKPNRGIIDNIYYLAEQGCEIIIRIPMIPGITDTTENINDIKHFVESLRRNIPVEEVPYNSLAVNNYSRLGMSFNLYGD